MKINVKVDTLVRELSELLWENDLFLITGNEYDSRSYIYVKTNTNSDPAVKEKLMKASIELLYTNVKSHVTLYWLRNVTARTEERIEINNAKSSFVEDKTSEALEALRSRVMVKALHAGRDNAEITTRIADAVHQYALESVERELDAANNIVPARASRLGKTL